MLKTMRRNVKSLKPILWLIVATFIIAIFAIWGGGIGGGEGRRSGTVASIGGAKISSDDYLQVLRTQMEEMQKQFGGELNANLVQQLGLPRRVLDQLVNNRLLLLIAKEMGIKTTDREVDLRAQKMFSDKGAFIGREQYIDIVRRYYRMTPGQFEDELRKQIRIEKVIQVLTAGLFITEDEVWQAYRKQNDSAKIEYLAAETAKMEIAGTPAEAELRAHFDKNAASYRVPEKRTADYVVLRTVDLKKEVVIKDGEIDDYYKDNAPQFQEPDKVQVSRIWLPFTAADKDAVVEQARAVQKRAAGGEDFAVLARSTSKDDKAAAGGDWGLFDWRSLTAGETAAVAKLEKDGVSDVVETETGAAVFKVTDKAPAVTKPLAEVRDTIKGLLEEEKARALVAERIGRLEKLALKEKSLDVAAQKEGLKPASTGALKKGDPLGDFDSSGAVSETLFTLKEKEISAPIFTYAGEALAELKTVEPERPATFDEVRDQVAKDIVDELKKEKALDKLREVRASLKDDWSAEAAKLQLEYKFVEAHKKEQYLSLVGDRAEIDGLLFSLPLKQTSEPTAVDEGYAIFRVLERTEATREEFEKVQAEERDKLLAEKKDNFLVSYLAKAREEKKLVIEYDVIQPLIDDVLSRFAKTS
jgi:peptidyl-prolyl cis-trans isomerase D